LFDLADNALVRLVPKIHKIDSASAELLTDTRNHYKVKLTWQSYIRESNFLVIEINDQFQRFQELKKMYYSFLESAIHDYNSTKS